MLAGAIAATLCAVSLGAHAASPGSPEVRLAAAGLTLPAPPAPVATYVTSARSGDLLFLSGHGECAGTVKSGKVGRELTEAEGYASARRVALCMLATIKAAAGDLGRVRRFVRVLGMVNATEAFTRHPAVINGFSDTMVIAFGDSAKAPRSAVGVASLPENIPVEIEAIVELTPSA